MGTRPKRLPRVACSEPLCPTKSPVRPAAVCRRLGLGTWPRRSGAGSIEQAHLWANMRPRPGRHAPLPQGGRHLVPVPRHLRAVGIQPVLHSGLCLPVSLVVLPGPGPTHRAHPVTCHHVPNRPAVQRACFSPPSPFKVSSASACVCVCVLCNTPPNIP